MIVVYVLILAVAVAAFVTYPFWGRGDVTSTEDPELAGLEAARESKYREIRDAETDLASGKLSREDFDKVNADLRRDAVEILDQLDRVKAQSDEPGDADAPEADEETPKPGDS